MPTAAQSQTMANAIAAIRSAENGILQASRATNDAGTLSQLTNEYNNLDSVLSQLVQAQATADDATFQQQTTTLKNEAASLNTQAAAINAIIADVAIAGQVAGYIAQAAAMLAAL